MTGRLIYISSMLETLDARNHMAISSSWTPAVLSLTWKGNADAKKQGLCL